MTVLFIAILIVIAALIFLGVNRHPRNIGGGETVKNLIKRERERLRRRGME